MAALLISSIPPAIGGDSAVSAKPEKNVIAKQPESNPLSFLDGKLVFDVQERLRMEVRDNNFDFNKSINAITDDTWLLQRFRLGMAVKPVDWLKIYAQGQDSREIDSDRLDIPGRFGAEGDDAFDLRQAYIELADYKAFPLGLKVGRQELIYGDERLVGAFDWNNFGRVFDAVKIRFQQPKFWVEAFGSRVVLTERDRVNPDDSHDWFSGVYFSTTYIPIQTTDFYVFYRDKGDNNPDLFPVNALSTVGAGNGSASRFAAIGTRIKSTPGKLAGFDYEGEFVYETGDVWATNHSSKEMALSAFAAHVGAGYTFPKCPMKTRIGVEYNYASGDHNPADGTSQSFQNLFPTNHKVLGQMDLFAWKNMHDPRVELKLSPFKNFTFQIDYHALFLADTSDYWYRANGITPVRTITPTKKDVRTIGASSFAGHEIDVKAGYQVCKNLKLEAGYSHFFAGSYLKDTGAHNDADFGYAQATLQF